MHKYIIYYVLRGELLDPYKEFMVLEDSSVSKEALQEDFNGHMNSLASARMPIDS